MANHDLPVTMRAWVHTTKGKPADVLSLTDVPVPPLPRPGSSDVLVKITHASICSGGLFLVSILPSSIRDKPCIPEFEFAGVVMAVDLEPPPSTADQSHHDPPLKAGDRVFGMVPIGRAVKRLPGSAVPSGSLAEYVVVPADHVARQPAGMPPEQAAGLGGPSSTMARTMMDAAKLPADAKVLVYGASSAVGTFVVQMAKEAVGENGQVVAVCGPRGQQIVKSLGADQVIDRLKTTPVGEFLARQFKDAPFDAILDTHGEPEIFHRSEPFLKQDGQYLSVGVSFKEWDLWNAISSILYSYKLALTPTFLGGSTRKWVQVMSDKTPKFLEGFRRSAEEGKLKVQVDSVSAMEDALKAYDRVENRRGIGKVIVKIQES